MHMYANILHTALKNVPNMRNFTQTELLHQGACPTSDDGNQSFILFAQLLT